jgi:hypothetical protein
MNPLTLKMGWLPYGFQLPSQGCVRIFSFTANAQASIGESEATEPKASSRRAARRRQEMMIVLMAEEC